MRKVRMRKKKRLAEAWVVYKVEDQGKLSGSNAVCEQAEWDEMERRRPGHHTLIRAGMTSETRVLLRRDFTHAMRMLRDAMDGLIKISGSSGLMDNNPVQRCWRDVHAISSHVVMNWDVPAENFGRMEFGLGLNPAYPVF